MRGVGGVCGARVGQREEACGAEREEKGVCMCVCVCVIERGRGVGAEQERCVYVWRGYGEGAEGGECVYLERVEEKWEKSVAQRKTGLLTSQ